MYGPISADYLKEWLAKAHCDVLEITSEEKLGYDHVIISLAVFPGSGKGTGNDLFASSAIPDVYVLTAALEQALREGDGAVVVNKSPDGKAHERLSVSLEVMTEGNIDMFYVVALKEES